MKSMETSEILGRVALLWPFDGQGYLGYDERPEKDKRYFAIVHVLKRLANGARTCNEAKELQTGCGYEKFYDMLARLTFGSLRLALLAGVPASKVEEALAEWKRGNEERSQEHFGTVRGSQNFSWWHGRLNDEILLLLELTEPFDRGLSVPDESLRASSWRLLVAAARIANIFRYPRRDFERLLSRNAPGSVLLPT